MGQSQEQQQVSLTPQSPTTSSSALAWAAPAFIPEDVSPAYRRTKKVHVSSMMWTEQPHAPSSPVMLGHANNNKSNQQQDYRQPPQHIIHISPIKSTHSHNITHSMNEKYSFRQMHNLDDTLLLPLTISVTIMNVPPPTD